MRAERSDRCCANQAENKTAVFERVGHSQNSGSKATLYQMQQGATVAVCGTKNKIRHNNMTITDVIGGVF